MNKVKLVLIFVVVTTLSSACAMPNLIAVDPGMATASNQLNANLFDDRFGTRYLASEIYTNLRVPVIRNFPIIVSTFVDLNELDRTSVFGRMMAEKLLDELNRKGFIVSEVRRAQDLFVKKAEGEFILTRDTSELAGTTDAKAVLAGTYVATSQALIINARLVDIKTPQILASVSYEVQMTQEIENLLLGIAPF